MTTEIYEGHYLSFGSKRERETFLKLLQGIRDLIPDEELRTRFNLMPHEVEDVKDVLRNSSL